MSDMIRNSLKLQDEPAFGGRDDCEFSHAEILDLLQRVKYARECTENIE